MSCFMVDDIHVDCLVRFAVEHRASFDCRGRRVIAEPGNAQLLGTLLMQANAASFAARYPHLSDDNAAHQAMVDAYRYDASAPLLGRVSARIASAGYAYQASERDDWETSPAKAFCDALDAFTGLSYEAARSFKPGLWVIDRNNLDTWTGPR